MAMTKDPFPFSLTPHRKGQAPKVRLHIRQMRADKSQPTTNENLQSWSCANLKTLAGISFSFSFFFSWCTYKVRRTQPRSCRGGQWGEDGEAGREEGSARG